MSGWDSHYIVYVYYIIKFFGLRDKQTVQTYWQIALLWTAEDITSMKGIGKI